MTVLPIFADPQSTRAKMGQRRPHSRSRHCDPERIHSAGRKPFDRQVAFAGVVVEAEHRGCRPAVRGASARSPPAWRRTKCRPACPPRARRGAPSRAPPRHRPGSRRRAASVWRFFGMNPGADALDRMRARLAAAITGDSARLDREDLELRPFLLQHLRASGDVPAGADAGDQRIEPAGKSAAISCAVVSRASRCWPHSRTAAASRRRASRRRSSVARSIAPFMPFSRGVSTSWHRTPPSSGAVRSTHGVRHHHHQL